MKYTLIIILSAMVLFVALVPSTYQMVVVIGEPEGKYHTLSVVKKYPSILQIMRNNDQT